MAPKDQASREARVRRRARKQGLALRKSRATIAHLDDHGEYRLVDSDRGFVVAGEKFDLTLDDVENWLGEA